jgi:indole-3-glycerol phosphate synthase
MAVLVETHTAQEIEDAMAIEPRIIGVNARNLKTLEIDLGAFTRLIPEIPNTVIRVAESGISQRSEVEVAQNAGAQAILVGETLVRSGDPRQAIDQLLGRTK